MAEFQLGLYKYVDKHKTAIASQLPAAVGVSDICSNESEKDSASVASSSSEVAMPPPPPPPPPPVDDLANRRVIVLQNTTNRSADRPMLQFYISETLFVEIKKIQRVANDPSAGCFYVINFCRIGANGKKYEFSFVENYAGDLYESSLYFMQSATKPKLALPPPEQLTVIDKKGFDISKLGDDDYPEDKFKVQDLEVFMLYKLGCWHMMIRKHKSKVKKNNIFC